MNPNFILLILLTLGLSYNCRGQNEPNTQAPKISDNNQSINKIAHFSDDAYYNRTDSAIQLLTVRDKIVFAIYYPSSYYQNCTGYGRGVNHQDFLHSHLRIFYGDRARSQLQKEILQEYRDSAIAFLMLHLDTAKVIIDYEKEVFVENLHGYECIPALLDIYAKNNDTDILTICMSLMNYDKFPPFLETKEYKELYEDPLKSSQSLRLVIARQIPLAQENITSVTTLARQYYDWKSNNTIKEQK